MRDRFQSYAGLTLGLQGLQQVREARDVRQRQAVDELAADGADARRAGHVPRDERVDGVPADRAVHRRRQRQRVAVAELLLCKLRHRMSAA